MKCTGKKEHFNEKNTSEFWDKFKQYSIHEDDVSKEEKRTEMEKKISEESVAEYSQ
jgi:hypothetical protein